MKTISWLASVTVGFALTATALAAPTEGWLTDLDKALVKAKAEKKPIFIEFTGSDWCPPCIAMHKNVFSKKEFIDAASKKFVLVEIDFPRGDKALAAKNEPLAEKFKLNGAPLPMAVLLNSDGKEFTRFISAEYPTIELFLKQLDAALKKMDLD